MATIGKVVWESISEIKPTNSFDNPPYKTHKQLLIHRSEDKKETPLWEITVFDIATPSNNISPVGHVLGKKSIYLTDKELLELRTAFLTYLKKVMKEKEKKGHL